MGKDKESSSSSSSSRKRRERSRSRSPKSSLSKRERRSSRDRGDRGGGGGDRERERGSSKRNNRSRSRSPLDRDRDRNSYKKSSSSSSASKSKVESVFDAQVLDKDDAQQKLEVEMQKRRERIEKWRAERRETELKREVNAKKEMLASMVGKKAWTLDGDDDDEEEPGTADAETNGVEQDGEEEAAENAEGEVENSNQGEAMEVEEDDEDPLDAFMRGVQEEVKKVNPGSSSSTPVVSSPSAANGANSKPNVVIMRSGVAKKIEKKDKGELVEQNMDGLEYSSEEESEDIDSVSGIGASKVKKDLIKIDHLAIDYPSFRKNFYVEVPELARMTPAEVDAYRCELEGIKVKGKGCPKPIKKWSHAGVSRKEMDILKKMSFETPTPIQCQAIPAIMSGRDLIGIAKTGSGKTLAFLLPMFRHILDQPPLEETDGPLAIIMAPTRELCIQIGRDAKKFGKPLNLRVICVYGGTGISEQIAELKRGAEVVVCTPGRMIDMLAANSGRVTNLKRVTYTVIDEADRMFDMGFEPQVMRIVDNIRPDRQTVMFSATFPRQMEALARRILNKPIEIQVGGRSVVCKDVEQNVVIIEEEQKFLKLLELLGMYSQHGSVIVFVEKQESADILLRDLIKSSYSCLSLHGGIDQYDRDSTINDFKSGKVKILVATSVAARGLDVKQLILVVNYDCPNHYEDYVHRCGRTGRAGCKGFAYTFITPEQDRYAGDITKAFELSETPVPAELTELWNSYKSKQEADGKQAKQGGGGFSGKGYKFDDTEAQYSVEKKKFQKHALGLQDSDDEDIEGDIEEQIHTMMAPKMIIREVSAASLIPSNAAGIPSSGTVSVDKLELAKKLASRIQLERNLGSDTKAQLTAEVVMKGGVVNSQQPVFTAKSVAEQLASRLNQRLNYQPQEDGGSGLDTPFSIESTNPPVQKKYEEELEINDFPQQARWRITSKETLAQIGDYSEAGITVRGTYVPTGKNPPEGERKLYLAIESMSELAVSKAKTEIVRLLKEEMLRIQTSAHHFIGSKGRYKVL